MYRLHKFKINSKYVKDDLINLKSEITNDVISPDWYLQKIEELQKIIHSNPKSKKRKLLKIA